MKTEAAWLALLRDARLPAGETLDPDAWAALTRLAAQHQLGALTYRLLADAGVLTQAPEDAQQRLRAMYMLHATRNAFIFRETGRIVHRFAAAGIPTLLLKGLHLARYVYPEPALRGMADLDVMVPRGRLIEAEGILLAAGYGPATRPDPVEFCKRSNHLAKLTAPGAVSEGGGQVVELHWTIERPTSVFQIDLDGLWARSRVVAFERLEARVLSPEDLLLHLALHVSYHHGFERAALKSLVDLQQVMRCYGDVLDGTVLARRANAWGAGGFIYATFRIVEELLGAVAPQSALDTLTHTREDSAVADAAVQYILLPSGFPRPYVDIAVRSGRARWGLVFRRLFPPRRTLARLYDVSPSSPRLVLLYVIRAVGLAIRRGALFLRALLPGAARRHALAREAVRRRISAWANGPGAEESLTAGSEEVLD